MLGTQFHAFGDRPIILFIYEIPDEENTLPIETDICNS